MVRCKEAKAGDDPLRPGDRCVGFGGRNQDAFLHRSMVNEDYQVYNPNYVSKDPRDLGFSGMLLALHATQVMGRVGWGGVGMMTFLFLAHM